MFSDLFDSPWKIAILAVLILVLFGAKKMPDAARSLGKSMRILKTEVQGLHGDDAADDKTTTQAPPQLTSSGGTVPGSTAAAGTAVPEPHRDTQPS